MLIHPLALSLLPETFAVCRLDPGTPLPAWVQAGSFFSFTGTPEETSLVCSMEALPSDIKADPGWRCLKVQGPLPFSLTGILSSVTVPLAQAHITVFAVATYDTDYILVKEDTLPQALSALTDAGHSILQHTSTN